jgi:hypothetical protein
VHGWMDECEGAQAPRRPAPAPRCWRWQPRRRGWRGGGGGRAFAGNCSQQLRTHQHAGRCWWIVSHRNCLIIKRAPPCIVARGTTFAMFSNLYEVYSVRLTPLLFMLLEPLSCASFYLRCYCAQASHTPFQDQQQKMAAIKFCQKTFHVSEHCSALCSCIL